MADKTVKAAVKVGFVLFTLLPFGATMALSFCNVNTNVTGYDITFAGWSNYLYGILQKYGVCAGFGGFSGNADSLYLCHSGGLLRDGLSPE